MQLAHCWFSRRSQDCLETKDRVIWSKSCFCIRLGQWISFRTKGAAARTSRGAYMCWRWHINLTDRRYCGNMGASSALDPTLLLTENKCQLAQMDLRIVWSQTHLQAALFGAFTLIRDNFCHLLEVQHGETKVIFDDVTVR